MKQFQVTEKDGQKWLRTYHPDEVIYGEPRRYTPLPYIGSLPVGALVDESKVREVRQHRLGGKWHITTSDLADTSFSDYWELETRVAYIDAEPSHDRHISPDKCVAGCTAYHGGEVRHHPDCPFYPESFTRMHDYWKRRAKVAEKLIGLSPSDPKTYGEYCRLFDEWEQLIEEGRNYGN